ncbi:hypothetical protein JCM3774_004346 [Rhodotorula dairenensis]
MGFCTRCGEITASSGRCKCGGTSRQSTSTALFDGSGSDRWQQRYVARSTPPRESSVSASVFPSVRRALPSSPSQSGGALLPAVQPSPTKLAQSFLDVDGEGELSSVFGSVLSPKDHWQCAACTKKFKQEEVIYPHPDAQNDSSLVETFFCRQCFADRFRKGDCKKCKYAVLSDAPFVKHDGNVWHKECYTCSYCANPSTDPVIDFAGQPSCEACFDAEAYKTCGIPPSPHLGQSEFFKPAAALPAPSKWGRPLIAGSPRPAPKPSVWSSYGSGAQDASASTSSSKTSAMTLDASKLSRLQLERNKSPIAPSLDELSDKLRRVGLQNPTAPPKPGTSAIPPPRSEISGRTLPTLQQQQQHELFRPLADGSPQPGSPDKTATMATVSPPSASPSKSLPHAQPRRPMDPDCCAICAAPLGDADFVELVTSRLRMHSSCFRCGGCGKQLGGGRFVEAEACWWHRECAPPPTVHRAIKTSLREPADEEPASEVTAAPSESASAVVGESPSCSGCGKQLGFGHSITVPRSGRSFHEACFCCAGCSRPFAGEKGFLERDGLPYHEQCVSKLSSTSSTRASATPRVPPSTLSTSRSTRDLPSPTKLPPKFAIPFSSSPTTPSVEPSLFSRRPRPPAGLGGLLICAGCSVRATEKETVLGPRGRRYHPKCLKCRECSRKLDSECRVGEDGVLRCEACRKTASRLPLQSNINTSRHFTSLT